MNEEYDGMRGILKSGFFWRFVGGFALGTVGLIALHPGAVAHNLHHVSGARVVAG